MRVSILFQDVPIIPPESCLISREIGAVTEFYGIVREREGDRVLTGLFYEAYREMAERVLLKIFQELNALKPICSVEFIHRTGWVPVGDASLFIRVQSVHRSEAFDFLSSAVRRMKEDVPIWKKSH